MNLSARIALVGGVAVLLSLGGTTVACGGRGGGTGGGAGGSTGTGGGNCAPFCAGTGGGSGGSSGTGGSTGGSSGTGGSTGGSSGTGGSTGADAGIIAAAKQAQFCSVTPTRVLGVVVTAVQSTQLETGTGNVRQNFWVVEPSNPSNGLYVFKDYTDTIGMMTNVPVNVGDVLNIDGNMTRIFPDSFINNGAEAYRYQMSEVCAAGAMGPMRIVVTGTATPPADIMVSSPFGLNPDGGKPKGYFVSDQRPGNIQPMAGARIHIPGPLTLSNPAPVEMQRINSTTTSFGFEVSGTNIPAGVLVRTQNTFGTFPDGGPRCDYGQMVRDGGRMVSFPNGIRGVWDTFSQTGCVNGTTSCTGAMSRDAGVVPGLGSNYTFAIFPMDCNDMAGAVVTP